MAQTEISITLMGGETQADGVLFRPGDLVQGSASIMASEPLKSRSVYIVLQWRTRGRGTTHISTVQRLDVHQGEIRPEWPLSFTFEFVLPQEPWSYTGHYINIAWEIMVGIDLSWQTDPTHTVPLIVLPKR